LEARILYIGRGTGRFLYYLNAKDQHNIMGVEVSPEQPAHCREFALTQVQLTPDLVSFLGERPSHGDCIGMKDVIEHLPRNEIIPTLAAIHDALATGGELLMETGNMASAIRARFAKNASHLMSSWVQWSGWTCSCLCTRSD
jgi:cyclopropane fatty-acyl-phospholipid synthase-like methyltransferase